jgi:acyl carrier protein
MGSTTAEEVRAFLAGYLAEKLGTQGRDSPADLPDDTDIMILGLVDSLDLLQLMRALGERFGPEIDFGELDPEQMTVVGSLCSYVSERATRA